MVHISIAVVKYSLEIYLEICLKYWPQVKQLWNTQMNNPNLTLSKSSKYILSSLAIGFSLNKGESSLKLRLNYVNVI